MVARVLLLLLCLGVPLLSGAAQLSAERRVVLKDMLLEDCGSCHGLTLKGGLGPALRPENLADKPRDFLIRTIRQGRPGTAMPPWGPILGDDEIAWIVDQLRSGKALQEAQK